MKKNQLFRTLSLDVETTGFDPKTGDRVVEIGVVELIDRRPTGRVFHAYLNPERSMPEEAFKVHGLSEKFLSDKPKFSDVAQEFVEFIDGAVIVIHNAAFDLNFLNMELARAGYSSVESYCAVVIDTLKISQRQGRTKRHNLNVLCSFYGVENSNRKLHGALLDAQLLAEVYVCMTRDQGSFLEGYQAEPADSEGGVHAEVSNVRVLIVSVSPGDIEAHDAYLCEIERESGGKLAVWRAIQV
jgi:DNA polymerase-3 subunit epsilon